ncbi:MAG: hypothetical protein JRL30_15135 [Deltaproteobacteria bacterium]|nr:hypothetical protein [Deltaproteobacteria bacterium]
MGQKKPTPQGGVGFLGGKSNSVTLCFTLKACKMLAKTHGFRRLVYNLLFSKDILLG